MADTETRGRSNPLKEAIGEDVERLVAKAGTDEENTAVDDVADLEQDDAETLLELLKRRAQVSTEISELEAEEQELNVALGLMMVHYETLGLKTPYGKLSIQLGSNSRVDKLKLLELKVKASIIEKATVTIQFPKLVLYKTKEKR